MDRKQWSNSVNSTVAAKRAGGRRRHNEERKRRMWERRFLILKVVAEGGDIPYGGQVRAANHFGVSEATISADLAWCESTGYVGSKKALTTSYVRGKRNPLEWKRPLNYLR